VADNFFAPGVMGRVNQDQDPATQNLINQYKGISDAMVANPRSADTAAYLDRFKSSLDGYSSQENQAMLEASRRGMQQDYQNAMVRAARTKAKNNVRGAAAAATDQSLNQGRARAEAETRQDLFIKNADEKQNRLNQYGGVLRSTEQSEFDNRNSAIENTRKATYDNKQDLLGREQYNLDRLAAENAGRAQSFFQTNAVGQANRAQAEQASYNKKALAAVAGGGRGRTSSSSGSAGNGYNEEYYSAVRDRIRR
jgi:hypothetical protein